MYDIKVHLGLMFVLFASILVIIVCCLGLNIEPLVRNDKLEDIFTIGFILGVIAFLTSLVYMLMK